MLGGPAASTSASIPGMPTISASPAAASAPTCRRSGPSSRTSPSEAPRAAASGCRAAQRRGGASRRAPCCAPEHDRRVRLRRARLGSRVAWLVWTADGGGELRGGRRAADDVGPRQGGELLEENGALDSEVQRVAVGVTSALQLLRAVSL